MFSQQRTSLAKKTVVATAALILIISMLSALITIAISQPTNLTIQNSGRITLVGLDAYGTDINSVNGAFSIALGQINLGRSKNVIFYLRSISNSPVTLAFSIGNWQPETLQQFMLISWNYSGNPITPNEEIPIKITVNAVASAEFVHYLITNQITSFSLNLNIQAEEVTPLSP